MPQGSSMWMPLLRAACLQRIALRVPDPLVAVPHQRRRLRSPHMDEHTAQLQEDLPHLFAPGEGPHTSIPTFLTPMRMEKQLPHCSQQRRTWDRLTLRGPAHHVSNTSKTRFRLINNRGRLPLKPKVGSASKMLRPHGLPRHLLHRHASLVAWGRQAGSPLRNERLRQSRRHEVAPLSASSCAGELPLQSPGLRRPLAQPCARRLVDQVVLALLLLPPTHPAALASDLLQPLGDLLRASSSTSGMAIRKRRRSSNNSMRSAA